jgi:hypothetical protein
VLAVPSKLSPLIVTVAVVALLLLLEPVEQPPDEPLTLDGALRWCVLDELLQLNNLTKFFKESKNKNYAANALNEALGTICRICARNKIARF